MKINWKQSSAYLELQATMPNKMRIRQTTLKHMEHEPYKPMESINSTMTHWKIALQKLLNDLLCCNSPKIRVLLKPNEHLRTFEMCGHRNKSDRSLNDLIPECFLSLHSSHIFFLAFCLLHSFRTAKSLRNIFMQLINELAIFVCYSAWATKHIVQ